MAVPAPFTNHLLDGLSCKDRNKLLNAGETVQLHFGEVLCEPRQAFGYAFFPLTGFISLLSTLHDRQPLELGLIGNEGMLGATLALGLDAAPLRAVVHGPGTALRLRVSELRRQFLSSPSLLKMLHRYQYVLMAQLSTSAACAHFHAVEVRLATFLLMAHDRAQSDHFKLTHESLSGMLGARRSGVTVAAGVLQRKLLIRYTRGEISILDRAGLEDACCECYSATIHVYAQLLGGAAARPTAKLPESIRTLPYR
ncbi:MAG TPA: Crp/Fnr family transcriptional regulator [Woeseiaceae bacterium]|nr:Crp/Fnr family transcriptional regulator [Woeseiaceae bacterium]